MTHSFSCQCKIPASQEADYIPIHDGSLVSSGTIYTAQNCETWIAWYFQKLCRIFLLCSFILFFITQNYTLVLGHF